MTEYTVIWEIQVSAESPEEAARAAKAVQQDAESIAHIYNVINDTTGETEEVDLDALDDAEPAVEPAANPSHLQLVE